MTHKTTPALSVFVAALWTLAAQAGGSEPPRGIAPPTRLPAPVNEPVGAATPATTAIMPRALRRAVVADAAKRLNVGENQVVLASAEQITWSDGAMGCPQPGMSYIQVLVPGYRVVARSPAGELVYHTDEQGSVVECASGRFKPGQKSLPAGPEGTGAAPRTHPPVKGAPDR